VPGGHAPSLFPVGHGAGCPVKHELNLTPLAVRVIYFSGGHRAVKRSIMTLLPTTDLINRVNRLQATVAFSCLSLKHTLNIM